jgi:glycerol kinase
MVGITRGTTAAHIARASLDSIAFQTYEVLKAMQDDSCIDIRELRVDGGATVNNQLLQFQADILHASVVRPRITETTALGAAYLAGLAVGFWTGTDDLRGQWELERKFEPQSSPEETRKLIEGWKRAIRAAEAWAEEK